MAQKRMFDKTIIDSDAFLELPITSQALYFHLNMRADDDGFIDNWKSISRVVGAKEDDIKILIAKSFIIPFESGVIVIKHWRINNYLQKDRKKTTRHIEELQSLKEVNGEYYLLENGEISNILMLDEEKEKPEWQIKRDEAYKKSSLPYSFLYKIRNAFNGCECPICHCTMKTDGIRKYIPTIQHLMPINKGGEHELYNIAIICYSCNSSMKDKVVESKLNNDEVIQKWSEITNNKMFYTRLTSANIDKNSIEYKKKSNISKDILPKEKVEIIYFNNLELNDLFLEFLELRLKLKCKNTDRAIKLLTNELNKYDDETKKEMLNTSIMNSWKSVYPPKQFNQKKGKTQAMNEVLKEIENGTIRFQ